MAREYLGNGNWVEWSNEIKNAKIYILEEEGPVKETKKMSEMVKGLYDIVKRSCDGLDSIYEDYLIGLIGIHGVYHLKEAKLLETCGVVNGGQLYVLCELKGED